MNKGIILAGGKGTRLSPVSFAVNKHLLPIFNKPMLHYPLSNLMLFDIKDILIIVNENDTSDFKNIYGDGTDFGIKISYKVQKFSNGIAEAFLIAEDFIGNDDVLLILGDNIFYGNGLYDLGKKAIKKNKGVTLFSHRVRDPERFGVIEFDSNKKVKSIIEKPKNPKSDLAVTGIYFFNNNVISYAKTLKPSKRGELEITDLNNIYLSQGKLDALNLERGMAWFDVGTFDAFFEASSFIKVIENLHSKLIGSPEEIAFSKGWISKSKLEKLILKYHKSKYAEVLEKTLFDSDT